jgi:hypothetical protein
MCRPRCYIASLSLVLTASGCGHWRRPTTTLIPVGYVGWIEVNYGVQGAPPLPMEDGSYLVRIPTTGSLKTSSKEEFGIAADQFCYVSGNDRQPLKLGDWGNGGMVWAGSTGSGSTDNPGESHEVWFIGTESQFKEFGWKLRYAPRRGAVGVDAARKATVEPAWGPPAPRRMPSAGKQQASPYWHRRGDLSIDPRRVCPPRHNRYDREGLRGVVAHHGADVRWFTSSPVKSAS